jgi:hypothetical protein
MAVLENLAAGRASWRALYPSRSGFEGGGVWASRLVVVRMLARGRSWREAVGCTAAGMAASCRPVLPQRRGWCPRWRRGSGDGCTGPMVMEETRLTGLTSRRCPGRAGNKCLSPFWGLCRLLSRVRRVGRMGVGSTVSRRWHWPYLTVPHSGGDVLTGRVGRTAPGYDSQVCQRRGADSSLTWVPTGVGTLNAPVGEQVRGQRAHGGLKRAELRLRGRPALERGGTLLEVASSPRARRNFACGGVRPSSEAKSR